MLKVGWLGQGASTTASKVEPNQVLKTRQNTKRSISQNTKRKPMYGIRLWNQNTVETLTISLPLAALL